MKSMLAKQAPQSSPWLTMPPPARDANRRQQEIGETEEHRPQQGGTGASRRGGGGSGRLKTKLGLAGQHGAMIEPASPKLKQRSDSVP